MLYHYYDDYHRLPCMPLCSPQSSKTVLSGFCRLCVHGEGSIVTCVYERIRAVAKRWAAITSAIHNTTILFRDYTHKS